MTTIDASQGKTLSILENSINLPSIPKVMFDVISTIKTYPGNTIKIAEAISKDQGITTKILSVANSALYGMQRDVSSLEFAIMILGSRELETLVTAISLSDAIKFKSVPNFNYKDYWTHSMIVGLASKDISRKLGYMDISGEAFVGGMLHDIGIQIIVKYFPNEFDAILKLVNSGVQFESAEKDVLGLTHQDVGKFIAQKWNLPKKLCDVIEFHHAPSEAQENTQLVSIVHLADSMTQEFKMGDGFWDADISFDLSIGKQIEIDSVEELGNFTNDYREVFKDTVDTIEF